MKGKSRRRIDKKFDSFQDIRRRNDDKTLGRLSSMYVYVVIFPPPIGRHRSWRMGRTCKFLKETSAQSSIGGRKRKGDCSMIWNGLTHPTYKVLKVQLCASLKLYKKETSFLPLSSDHEATNFSWLLPQLTPAGEQITALVVNTDTDGARRNIAKRNAEHAAIQYCKQGRYDNGDLPIFHQFIWHPTIKYEKSSFVRFWFIRVSFRFDLLVRSPINWSLFDNDTSKAAFLRRRKVTRKLGTGLSTNGILSLAYPLTRQLTTPPTITNKVTGHRRQWSGQLCNGIDKFATQLGSLALLNWRHAK